MPYYSEFGLYSNPSSALSSNIYVPGPYSNHSSIIAANFTRPPSISVSRNFRSYKPHLATISENQSTLRRINSPKLILHHTKRPIKINTADIDVSINKYRKYERPQAKSELNERKTKSPSSLEQREAKPNKNITRDRPTIRIQTIHKDLINKSWRDNFDSSELTSNEEKPRQKKTPGELLKEKFLIRSNEEKQETQVELKKRCKHCNNSIKKSQSGGGIQKTPSFHDICTAITSNTITTDEELNPGQPIEIQRRQSRQLSTDDLINEIKRSSSELSTNELIFLEMLNESDDENEDNKFNSRGSVKKKKKLIKKKSNEKLTLSDEENNLTKIQRRNTQKKLSKRSLPTKTENSEESKHLIKDISQVEIERIKRKPKPIITATVDVEEKPVLKAVINDVHVEESPKKKPTLANKFKFNVIVEEIEEKKLPQRYEKIYGKLYLPTKNNEINTKVVKSNHFCGHIGHVLDDIKEIPNEEIEAVCQNKIEEKKRKKMEEEKLHKNEGIKLEVKNLIVSLPKLKMQGSKTNEECQQKSENKNTFLNEIEKNKSEIAGFKGYDSVETTKDNLNIESKTEIENKLDNLKKNNESENNNPNNISKNNIKKYEQNIVPTNKSNLYNLRKTKSIDIMPSVVPKLQTNSKSSTELSVKSQVKSKTEDENLSEDFWNLIGSRESVYIKKKVVIEKQPSEKHYISSKRSLVNKANIDDPDLDVFVVPDEQLSKDEDNNYKKQEGEEDKTDVFVPLQSNRLSQFMHPFKKPEQFDECPIEIYARPKTIRKRHYPRPRQPPKLVTESSSSYEDSSSEEDKTSTSSNDENEKNIVYKIGASTSSNDSGFDSAVNGSRNKDCDVNCHKKCEKLTGNLCGVNQKLIVEAIESVRKGSSENRESPISNPSNNPAYTLDTISDLSELDEYSHSSIFENFKRTGHITPPATTIPRFRKYCVEDFNFLKVLGKGSFGKVLLAELKETDYYYAIKCLKKDVVLEDDDVECTLIERKVLALGTKHPYLCHLLCTFQTESHLFFVMEYLNGGDLMFHIQQSGRFTEPRAKFYGAEIVSGLKFLHIKGIVYRDLKLDNILLDFDGHVRIADFGMCKLQIFLDRMADTFCGTPDYMAPEIIKGQHYNQCVDWWSFGVLLYEMLIGQSPFSGCDEDELFWSICNEKPVLPRFLSTEAGSVLLAFLEKDAGKRLGNRNSNAGEILDHPFFRSIQWDKLEERKLESPFKPDLTHPLDTKYFDKTFTVEKAKLTPIEQNILQSMDQIQFQGFSYTNPNATDK